MKNVELCMDGPSMNKYDCIQCNNRAHQVCPHANNVCLMKKLLNAPEDISNDVLKPMGKGVDGLSIELSFTR